MVDTFAKVESPSALKHRGNFPGIHPQQMLGIDDDMEDRDDPSVRASAVARDPDTLLN
jgi:hypothetical protein